MSFPFLSITHETINNHHSPIRSKYICPNKPPSSLGVANPRPSALRQSGNTLRNAQVPQESEYAPQEIRNKEDGNGKQDDCRDKPFSAHLARQHLLVCRNGKDGLLPDGSAQLKKREGARLTAARAIGRHPMVRYVSLWIVLFCLYESRLALRASTAESCAIAWSEGASKPWTGQDNTHSIGVPRVELDLSL